MYMYDSNKIGQFKHENDTWVRTLDYLQQENIHLKNRLGEIAKRKLDKSHLEQVEYFQNSFLNKDAIIALLRRDIAGQNRDIDKAAANEGINADWLSRQEQLRADMNTMEKEFGRLKFEFNKYLADML